MSKKRICIFVVDIFLYCAFFTMFLYAAVSLDTRKSNQHNNKNKPPKYTRPDDPYKKPSQPDYYHPKTPVKFVPIDSLVRIRDLTAQDLGEILSKNSQSTQKHYSAVLTPWELERTSENGEAWDYLHQTDIHHHVTKIIEQIKKSQNTSFHSQMIPLCVSYASKDSVKSKGAIWDNTSKTWFWPLEKPLSLVEEWVPKFHLTDYKKPIILPQLVPAPLFGENLRKLLPKAQWNELRKLTCESTLYRCIVCGCRAAEFRAECHEIWEYDDDYSPNYSMVYFKGLQTLCTECHRVCHFGKAELDGYKHPTIARMMVLNGWSLQYTEAILHDAFEEWEMRSKRKWIINLSYLDGQYSDRLSHQDVILQRPGLSVNLG